MSNQKLINHFIEFIKAISDKPGMYLANNVEDINLIIQGYRSGCSFQSSEYLYLDQFLDEFNKFINLHFNTSEQFQWARLIRFYCVNDFTTLEFFKRMFSEFLEAYRQE